MNIAALRVLQAQLRAKGAKPGSVDGRMGPATRAAIAGTLTRLDPGTATDWRGWTLASPGTPRHASRARNATPW